LSNIFYTENVQAALVYILFFINMIRSKEILSEKKKLNIHFQLKFSCDNTWVEKSDSPESHTAVLSAASDMQES
jgi:hypothetical protein